MKSRVSILGALALCLSLAANAQLNNPANLAFDGSGNLWVANKGNEVLELVPPGWTVGNTITNGVNGASRLFFVGSELYVLNTTGNNITIYDKLTTAGAKLAGTVSIPSSVAGASAAAVDAYGDVYISGNTSDNVVALNIGGGLVETLTKDTSGFPFTSAGAMAIHGKDIYVGFGPQPGENAVINYNVGEFLTGDPKEITVYNDNVNTGPTQVAFDSTGNVYISELYSGTGVKYVAGKGTKPAVVYSTSAGYCSGIAVDKSGNVYVSNSGLNDITVYNNSGVYQYTIN
jgi:sugar lactone lactonase YvrE